MINEIRSWLSINFIALGVKLCPFEEMREYLRSGLNLGIESYFSKDIDE